MDVFGLARSYIEPEAKRLISIGVYPKDFKIRQALVLLPRNNVPIIQFNEAIQWEMKMDTSADTLGQAIYLSDIRKICMGSWVSKG